MQVSDILSVTRRLTRTNNDTYSEADFLVDVNDAYQKTIARIIEKTTSFNFAGRVATTDVVNTNTAIQGATGHDGKYGFPDDILKIVRVEIQRTEDGIFTKLEERDEQQIEIAVGDTLTQFYMIFNHTLTISPLPTEDVINGLKIWYEQRRQSLTSLTQTPLFEESFHRILALETARSFFVNDPTDSNAYRKSQIEGELAEYFARLDKFYATKENRNYKIKVKNVNYAS